jgi:hypothetical protein
MTSCTYDMPRSACNVSLETYHGASTIILRTLDERKLCNSLLTREQSFGVVSIS